jgi:hypothetical protein
MEGRKRVSLLGLRLPPALELIKFDSIALRENLLHGEPLLRELAVSGTLGVVVVRLET